MSDKGKALINIENIVASATLKQRIDLNPIVRISPEVEYRPERFPGLVYRLKRPKTATMIFSTGKMVCTGAKSERQAQKAVLKVVDELKRDGIVILGRPDITIQNIVASASLGGYIDLEMAVYGLKKTMYEPEQFPGLIYRMDEPKVVILVFTSGKLVCTGAKKEIQVHIAVKKLQEILESKSPDYVRGPGETAPATHVPRSPRPRTRSMTAGASYSTLVQLRCLRIFCLSRFLNMGNPCMEETKVSCEVGDPTFWTNH